MRKVVPFLVLSVSVAALVAIAAQPVAGQAGKGPLVMFADMALFSGNGMPRNCFTMNRYKVGEPVGFRVTRRRRRDRAARS